jgi:peptidoglycan/LPS O-acetylase OafA/YrhL
MMAACAVPKSAYVFGCGYYLNIILAGVVILSLSEWRPSKRFADLDQRLGDLAYPIFLTHWLVAFVVATVTARITRDWVLLLETLPALLLVSGILAWLNGIYIEPWRRAVRERSVERLEANGAPVAVLLP